LRKASAQLRATSAEAEVPRPAGRGEAAGGGGGRRGAAAAAAGRAGGGDADEMTQCNKGSSCRQTRQGSRRRRGRIGRS
jgi:hypothetical protein